MAVDLALPATYLLYDLEQIIFISLCFHFISLDQIEVTNTCPVYIYLGNKWNKC